MKPFSSKRGLFFTVKGPRALPTFHTDTPPRAPPPPPRLFGRPPTVIFSHPPRAGGGWVRVEFGSARGPFTVKKRPLFDENALMGEVPRRTSLVPLAFPCFFFTLFNRGVFYRRAFRLPGAGGGSFPLYGGTFARSYSVSKHPTTLCNSCTTVP